MEQLILSIFSCTLFLQNTQLSVLLRLLWRDCLQVSASLAVTLSTAWRSASRVRWVTSSLDSEPGSVWSVLTRRQQLPEEQWTRQSAEVIHFDTLSELPFWLHPAPLHLSAARRQKHKTIPACERVFGNYIQLYHKFLFGNFIWLHMQVGYYVWKHINLKLTQCNTHRCQTSKTADVVFFFFLGISLHFNIWFCVVSAVLSCSALLSRSLLTHWSGALLPLSQRLLPARARPLLLPLLPVLWDNHRHWCSNHTAMFQWVSSHLESVSVPVKHGPFFAISNMNEYDFPPLFWGLSTIKHAGAKSNCCVF